MEPYEQQLLMFTIYSEDGSYSPLDETIEVSGERTEAYANLRWSEMRRQTTPQIARRRAVNMNICNEYIV